MNYWLLKSEPEAFSINDLAARPNQTEHWDGVRNYQARNMLRDQMKVGDLAFFYHSNCTPPGIVGVVEIVKEGYPDFTAFEANGKYYDSDSKPDKPRWFMVDVKFKRKFKRLINLDELRQQPTLLDMQLLKKGNRLSIVPMTLEQWQTIIDLE
jgi:predicted RNA-binding protein with PUA-like domain